VIGRGPTTVILVLAAATAAAADLAPAPSVFCVHDASGTRVVALAPAEAGALRFGLSLWLPNGQNVSVFGIAIKIAGGWRYDDGPPGGGCRLTFTINGAGGVHVVGDTSRNCANMGGQGAAVTTADFPAASRESAVTHELDDPEAFQHAGHCVPG
jgi:hypothetical protein